MVLSKMERTENTAADAAVRAAAADMLSQKSENRRMLLLKSWNTEIFVINTGDIFGLLFDYILGITLAVKEV